MRHRTVVAIQLAVGALIAVAVVIAHLPEGDPNVFLVIANRIAEGQIPYVDFPLEYPPLALLPLALPRLAAGADGYQTAFTLVMVVFSVGTAAVVGALAARGFGRVRPALAVAVFTAFVLAAAPSVIWRFDLLPAFMTALALLAVAWRKPSWAGFALAIGVGVKLYPAFLLPVLLGYYALPGNWRSAALVVVGFAIPTVALLAQVLLVAGPGALSFVTYQGDRGIEIESLVGGLAMLADVLGGPPARVDLGFGSWQVTSPVIAALAVPGFMLQLVGTTALVASGVIAARSDIRTTGGISPRTLAVHVLATLLLVMLANKVLSNQYVAWLLPFGALLPLRQSVLLFAVCALTTVVYPFFFDRLLDGDAAIVAALNIRNALLAALFVWLIAPAIARAGGSRDNGAGRRAGSRAGSRATVSEGRYVRDPTDETGRDSEHQ